MSRYIALVDGETGAYGVTFPDLPGCVAMGDILEEAVSNAAEALRDWAEVTEARGGFVPPPTPSEFLRKRPGFVEAISEGATVVFVPLIRNAGSYKKVNLSLDVGVLAAIDEGAANHGVTRSAMVEILAKTGLPAMT
jgi:predicted RNase H-like HicB family nuclease